MAFRPLANHTNHISIIPLFHAGIVSEKLTRLEPAYFENIAIEVITTALPTKNHTYTQL